MVHVALAAAETVAAGGIEAVELGHSAAAFHADVSRKDEVDEMAAAARFGITAMRRLGQPDDVAGPAAFVTGQSFNVCCGIVLS